MMKCQQLQVRLRSYEFNSSRFHDQDLKELLGVPLELPSCRPCPSHGTCDGPELKKCSNGYIIKTPIFPFHSSCAPDLVKYANVEKLRSELAEILSIHAGAVECGNAIGDAYLSELEVKAALSIRHVRYLMKWLRVLY